MPGTIHVSILELMGLPSLQQSSSMGIKVSMGKQSYDVQEKGDSSFLLASLRDNLSVTVYDSEGNEIAQTGVDSRSIVEKGLWDDIFPFQGGGHVRMSLHFILTEEEQKKIRSMRESAARKKQEDIYKRSHSSSDLVLASGARDGVVNQADRKPYKISSGSSVNDHSQVRPDQKKQLFFMSKSSGALDKLPDFERVKKEIQNRDEEQRSRLDRTPSNALRTTRYQNTVLHKQEASPLKVPKQTVPVSAKPVLSKLETVLVEKVTEKERVTTDIPLKVPKMMVPVRAKPVLSKLETIRSPILVEKANDIPLKLPKKTNDIPLSAKPVLSNLETVRAPVLVEKVTESEKVTSDIPLKSPKTVSESAKPVLSNLETLHTSISEEIATQQDVSLKAVNKTVSVNTKPVLGNLENLSGPISEEAVKSTEQFKEKNILQAQPESSNEVSIETIILPKKLHRRVSFIGESEGSWKTLSRRLPRHTKKQVSTSFDSSVFKKTWRRKRPKSCENYVKPKVSCGNKYYPPSSFRGWIFMEEMINPCVLEGDYSNCSRDTLREKQKDEESSDKSPDRRPNTRRPARQVVNIVIMVGFGILVLLTRQGR